MKKKLKLPSVLLLLCQWAATGYAGSRPIKVGTYLGSYSHSLEGIIGKKCELRVKPDGKSNAYPFNDRYRVEIILHRWVHQPLKGSFTIVADDSTNTYTAANDYRPYPKMRKMTLNVDDNNEISKVDISTVESSWALGIMGYGVVAPLATCFDLQLQGPDR